MILFLFIFLDVRGIGFLDNEAVVPFSLLPFVLKTLDQFLNAVFQLVR